MKDFRNSKNEPEKLKQPQQPTLSLPMGIESQKDHGEYSKARLTRQHASHAQNTRANIRMHQTNLNHYIPHRQYAYHKTAREKNGKNPSFRQEQDAQSPDVRNKHLCMVQDDETIPERQRC
jgi:hypothetical protein